MAKNRKRPRQPKKTTRIAQKRTKALKNLLKVNSQNPKTKRWFLLKILKLIFLFFRDLLVEILTD